MYTLEVVARGFEPFLVTSAGLELLLFLHRAVELLDALCVMLLYLLYVGIVEVLCSSLSLTACGISQHEVPDGSAFGHV